MLSNMMGSMMQEQTKENVLNSLYLPHIKDRHEWISLAHQKTFGSGFSAQGKPSAECPMGRSTTLADQGSWHILAHWQGRQRQVYIDEIDPAIHYNHTMSHRLDEPLEVCKIEFLLLKSRHVHAEITSGPPAVSII